MPILYQFYGLISIDSIRLSIEDEDLRRYLYIYQETGKNFHNHNSRHTFRPFLVLKPT